MLIALAGVGFFIVGVYNPFNGNANNLQSPILNSNNPQHGVGASVTTVTSVTTDSTSATASGIAGNSTSGGVSLLTGSSSNTSTRTGGDDGGSDS